MSVKPIKEAEFPLGGIIHQDPPLLPLPVEIFQRILIHSGLSVYTLTSCGEVCKAWKAIIQASDDYSIIKFVKLFGKNAWQKYFGYQVRGVIPEPPESIICILKLLSNKFASHFKPPPACSLILMPKGLTLNKLSNLVQDPRKGMQSNFDRHSWRRAFEQLGEEAIDESYWVLLTNSLVVEFKNLEILQQKLLIIENNGQGWSIPRVLEASVCAFMNHASCGNYLFGTNPLTYTRCEETISWYQLVLGGFDSLGLVLNFHYNFDQVVHGAAACFRDFD
jgi:hypothetical protein